MPEEKDYLDELIETSCGETPGFADAWEPYAQMIRLSDERVRLGLSQQEVANRMGVDRTAVSRMESHPANVGFGRILLYAKAVGAELVVKPSNIPDAKATKRRRHPVKAGAF